MPPKEKTEPLPEQPATEHTGLAHEARTLADTEGITVAAAVEKLTKKAAAKDVG